MDSTLLLHQCPACLVRLTWIVLMIGGSTPYSCCFVEYCLSDSCLLQQSNTRNQYLFISEKSQEFLLFDFVQSTSTLIRHCSS